MQKESDQFENFRVFVGSIPGHFQKHDIALVFQGIAKISKIVLPKKQDDFSTNKGYCYLYLDFQDDYRKLLSLGALDIGHGRHVVCKPYKKGGQLKKSNLENNLRRIILKDLPNGTTEKEIYRACSEFGAVEYAFIYKEDQWDEDYGIEGPNFRKRNTASVFFHSSETAKEIISTGSIHLKSKFVRVEPFLTKFKKDLMSRMNDAREGDDPNYMACNSLQSKKPVGGYPMTSKYGTALYCRPLNRRYFEQIGPRIEQNHHPDNLRFKRTNH